MDGQRFDDLTRALASRLPRRALAGLVAAALSALSLDETEAKGQRNGPRQKTRRQRAADSDQRNGRPDSGKGDQRDRDAGKPSDSLRAEGKKKKKKATCVGVGGSCKKPKKGKARKCCAGHSCDAATKRCVASGGACDQSAFAECFAPMAAEWDAALAGCADACSDSETAACEQCLEEAIDELAEPFAFCFERTCSGPNGAARAASKRSRVAVEAESPTPCDPLELNKCQIAWILGELAANLTLGRLGAAKLASAIAAKAGATVLRTCNQQYGCPGGRFCSRPANATAGFCCPDCDRYDPNRRVCEDLCTAPDEECRFGRCVKNCDVCVRYQIELRCGQIVNNCGETLNCACIPPRKCRNGRCVLDDCAPNRVRAQGAGDECCIPQTCAEMSKTCGQWSDGCGDMLDCGECATAAQPGAYCDFVTGTCVCYPDNACLAGTCGAMSDGCGGTKNCGSCATSAKPRAVCGDDNRCDCTPYTCAELGKTCGVWNDGCGGTVDCGSTGRQTCAELGKECGVWDDGCNGTIDCGGCATENRPRAYCDQNGACVCMWDGWCHGGCGPEPDGCGGTVDCGRCDSEASPKAYCGEDRECHCEPDSCASLGESCGYHRNGCGGWADCGNHHLLCGRAQDICCAEGQTCCGLDWEDSACCDWSACHKWPGGKPKGCCPDIQQCLNKSGVEACCPEGWRCRGGGDPAHPTENCCVMSGQGHEALHLDGTLCCSGKLASLYPHVCE